MSLMYAQMGMKVVGAYGAYAADSHDAKMQKITQEYRKAMSDISASMQLNAQTENEINFRDAAMDAAIAVEAQSLADRANAEVSAAVSGVRGGSVKASMRALTRSRLRAKKAHQDKLEAQHRVNTNERRNVALARAFNKDISVIPQPSVASSLLGLGASLIDVYDSHQPEGQKIEDVLAKLGG